MENSLFLYCNEMHMFFDVTDRANTRRASCPTGTLQIECIHKLLHHWQEDKIFINHEAHSRRCAGVCLNGTRAHKHVHRINRVSLCQIHYTLNISPPTLMITNLRAGKHWPLVPSSQSHLRTSVKIRLFM